ncbi:MAG: ABC transporter permease [Lachnospiraceae bacterium]|nr:ABC transporter permease [Lachnospiraceae bacterium]
MNMFKYIARRLVLAVVVMFGISIITFCISHLVPGDPLVANLGQTAMSDPEIVAAYEAKWGLDQPLPVQYINYMKNLFQGDLGTSIRTKQPVLSDLAQYIPATFEMATFATLISIILGLLFGLLSAARHNKLPDHVLRVISLMGISIPAFWLSILCLYFFYLRLGIVPGSGRVSAEWLGASFPTGFLIFDAITYGEPDLLRDALSHLILPSFVLAASTMGILTRTVRSSMLEEMQQDYVRTARAKGLSEGRVLRHHVLKNGLIPSVTMFGLSYGSLLGGTVLVETIFSYPGIGLYAYKAASTLDFPAIMGTTLFIAAVNVLMNFFVDIIYALIDPRIRY